MRIRIMKNVLLAVLFGTALTLVFNEMNIFRTNDFKFLFSIDIVISNWLYLFSFSHLNDARIEYENEISEKWKNKRIRFLICILISCITGLIVILLLMHLKLVNHRDITAFVYFIFISYFTFFFGSKYI